MIHARIPIEYDFLGPKGSIVSELRFCGSKFTSGDGNYRGRRFECGKRLCGNERRGGITVAEVFLG